MQTYLKPSKSFYCLVLEGKAGLKQGNAKPSSWLAERTSEKIAESTAVVVC